MKKLYIQPRAQGCAFVAAGEDKIVMAGHTSGAGAITRLQKAGAAVIVLSPPEGITPDAAIVKLFPIPEEQASVPDDIAAAIAQVK